MSSQGAHSKKLLSRNSRAGCCYDSAAHCATSSENTLGAPPCFALFPSLTKKRTLLLSSLQAAPREPTHGGTGKRVESPRRPPARSTLLFLRPSTARFRRAGGLPNSGPAGSAGTGPARSGPGAVRRQTSPSAGPPGSREAAAPACASGRVSRPLTCGWGPRPPSAPPPPHLCCHSPRSRAS